MLFLAEYRIEEIPGEKRIGSLRFQRFHDVPDIFLISENYVIAFEELPVLFGFAEFGIIVQIMAFEWFFQVVETGDVVTFYLQNLIVFQLRNCNAIAFYAFDNFGPGLWNNVGFWFGNGNGRFVSIVVGYGFAERLFTVIIQPVCPGNAAFFVASFESCKSQLSGFF